MKPGITIVPLQSTISASPAEIVGAISAILFPSIRTSAFSKSPHSRVEAQDDAATQQNAALSAVTDEALKIRGRGRAQLSELPRARGGVGFSPAAGRRNCGGCKPRRARSDEVASVHVSLL
jgi:hypothetical protein